ncbi:MAG TPA: hypothetical protein PLU72_04565 [Candidatus Ozemobacteraceae bacterium]|nr:hypothetical protein [Candidatus Ozemobacteraceae bacterium]
MEKDAELRSSPAAEPPEAARAAVPMTFPVATDEPDEAPPWDWERIFALLATMTVLFFYTRSCPFSSGTYWDLLFAREFDLNINWALLPETIALGIAQSAASLAGLKTLCHLLFFALGCLLLNWIFRGREILPGLITLGIFSFAMQPLLGLRALLQMIFTVGLLALLDSDALKEKFGVMLIPITAAASALGLNSWVLVALVTSYALFRSDYRLTLILSALIGILCFPEGAASAVSGDMPLSTLFPNPDDQQLMSLIAGIFLIPNLMALSRIDEENFPIVIFYAFTGLLALANPGGMPLFVVTGVVLLLKALGDIEPLSLNTRLAGTVILVVLIHLFLFLNPSGFSINPTVRGELGAEVEALLQGRIKSRAIAAHDLGELMWKGLLNMKPDDITALPHIPRLRIIERNGALELIREEEEEVASDTMAAERAPTP